MDNGEVPVNSAEKFKLEYTTVNNYILHYSNVRSALAAFLITVSLASFGAYYGTTADATGEEFLGVEGGRPLLWVAGYTFLLAAILCSLWFAYLTERTTAYSRLLWKWGVEGGGNKYPGGFRGKWTDVPTSERRKLAWAGVVKDPMVWLLVIGATTLAVTFQLFENSNV